MHSHSLLSFKCNSFSSCGFGSRVNSHLVSRLRVNSTCLSVWLRLIKFAIFVPQNIRLCLLSVVCCLLSDVCLSVYHVCLSICLLSVYLFVCLSTIAIVKTNCKLSLLPYACIARAERLGCFGHFHVHVLTFMCKI